MVIGDDPDLHEDLHHDPHDGKRAAIHAAAVGEFSRRGFAATSMANIAEAAGMSRPALYQYFRNKGDIFASAFIALLEEHIDRALDALDQPGSIGARLDGFLQRFEGDLWQQMAASPHSEEILGAKNAQLAEGAVASIGRLWDGLAVHLEKVRPGQSAAVRAKRDGWVDVLHFGPKGFKLDQPSVEALRHRLTTLAHSVAADIEAS